MTAAKPETTKGKKLTAIWIIPIVAAVLGAWMVVYTYMTEGPEIRVTFNTASGLEEGKTVVKFRDVEIGQVQEVLLGEDMQSVTAVIKMRREALPLLREDTRFWVVTAQIGGGGISGLDTLLSGAYIQISPGESRIESLDFVGLEEPPLTPIGADGLRLILIGERSASVSSGDPVLYHGFKVGRVESRTFDAENKQIRYVIFIDAPYDSLVNTSSRFWDVSGISMSAGAEGFEVSTGSLESILIGGVTFGRPPDLEPGVAVDNNTEFRLFPGYDEILDTPHVYRDRYVVGFSQSVKGLLPGSPVEYRGINIGEVERIMMSEMVNKGLRESDDPQGLPIPVLIYIEPGRFFMPDTQESLGIMREALSKGVAKGLRVSLIKGNLLTGAQVINLEYYEDAEPAAIGEYEGYPTMPTIVTGLGGLEAKITRLLDKANELPLEQTIGSINLALAELNQSLKVVHNLLDNDQLRAIPSELNSTLEALRQILESDNFNEIPGELKSTLAAARFQLQGESAEAYQLGRTLKEVESAARALREFLDLMEQKPESLIRGKKDTE
jgi:paraquat-inducible protein B